MSLLATIKKPKNWFVLALASLVVCTVTVFATTEADTSREYHLKAAFLRYVAKFVTWPEGATSEDAINICIYGEVPSLKGLNSINGRMIDDKPILVRPISNLDSAKSGCQILYIMKSEEDKEKAIINEFKGLPILTFSDLDTFAQNGGGMNFYIANNRMAIMINQRTVSQAKLGIHPRMLRLVTIVPGEQIEIEEPASAVN